MLWLGWGRSRPPADTLLPYMCYHTKFGLSRSKHLVQLGVPKLWERCGPSPWDGVTPRNILHPWLKWSCEAGGGGSPDEAPTALRTSHRMASTGERQLVGANPIPIPHPTNLALSGHKITLYSIYNTYNAQLMQAYLTNKNR